MAKRVYKGSGEPTLGRTLPSMLEDACRLNPNDKALCQLRSGKWQSLSSQEFLTAADEMALGFLSWGLARQDRVCFFMQSDADFGVADMGCLIAGIIDVPIHLTHDPESVGFVLRHAQARALIVSDADHLQEIVHFLPDLPFTKRIAWAQAEPDEDLTAMVPDHIQVKTLDDLRALGRAALREDPEAGAKLRAEIDPRDIATVIYTSGTTGEPKGVMLSHENLSSNAYGSFQEMKSLRLGKEVILSYLPLSHVFARMLHYGHIRWGSAVYFTTPERFSEHLKEIHPTGFASVPHVLEKIEHKIIVAGAQMTGVKKRAFDWALALARKFDLTRFRGPVYRARLALADKLVYSKWRQGLGGKVELIICGGAALGADVVNLFAAAGISVLQGYGLTESSPVITYNREESNRPGTVGTPLPGIEIKLADDGEILTRGPHVMRGYYRNPQATSEAIDSDGWLHTGDIGTIGRGGYLSITDRKKNLFKLSTGKYVIPQPLENALHGEALVEEAVVVGPGRPYCTALIFPQMRALTVFARLKGIDPEETPEKMFAEPKVQERFRQMIDKANHGLPHWSTIKRFKLIHAELTPQNGMLTPTLKVRRKKIYERFADKIDDIYGQSE